MAEPPMVQTSHSMPSIIQTTPSNNHINQYPGINNNYMPMKTPVFSQGSNISPPNQFIHSSNQFSAPVSCSPVPNYIPNVSPVQKTSTRQPFTEESQPMLHSPFLYSDMPHALSYAKTNVHGQHLMQSPQIVRPNLAAAIQQEIERSHLAAYNTCERPRNSTDQATHETMTEIYAEQQKKSWLQQQQQQCGEYEMLDLLNNIQPLISHGSQQNVEDASVPLLHLASSHDRVTTQTVPTAAHVQCQKGKQIVKCFQHVCIF